ncbi:checkpoint protein Hus1/Mec3 [Entophlyctis helioformis]|nr:checkpoint protein Hus1/Mec3 [Entophlyctis helioformis]
MRMRANIVNPTMLIKLGQTLERLHKQWIFHMAPDRLRFTVSRADFQTGTQVWAQLGTDALFEEFRIESASDNQIWLELNGDHLLRALRSGQKASQVVMRLTKKDNLPVLSFTITNQSRQGKMIVLVQDVPVRVISPDKTDEFREPMPTSPEVMIMLPPIHTVRTVAERMRSIGQRLVLSGNMAGQFSMSVSNDIVRVQTFFKDLVNVNQQSELEQPSSRRSPTEFVVVEVDIRDFIKFVQCYQVHPTKIVCFMYERQSLLLYAILGETDDDDQHLDDKNGSLIYRIPLRSK